MSRDLDWVARATGATSARRGERIQSLWSGYGEIVRVELTGADVETVVLKSVEPPARLRGAVAPAFNHRAMHGGLSGRSKAIGAVAFEQARGRIYRLA